METIRIKTWAKQYSFVSGGLGDENISQAHSRINIFLKMLEEIRFLEIFKYIFWITIS